MQCDQIVSDVSDTLSSASGTKIVCSTKLKEIGL